MFSRVDSGTAVGAGLAGSGVVGEVAKEAAKASQPQNLMDVDILFGMLMPHFYLTVTGAIAIVGTALLILSFIRGNKEKRKREERDKIL